VGSFDEQDLGQRVDGALATITSGPVPAAAIVARGRRIRRRRRAARAGAVAAVAALAVAVPAGISLNNRLGTPGPVQPAHRLPHPAKQLPAKMTGLPMPAGTNFQLLVSARDGAAWYSTATRQTEPITGLPASSAGYQFERVYGGWFAAPNNTASSPCPTFGVNACAGPPKEFYFIADGSLTATRIGAGYAGDGVAASSRPGAVWVATYPRATAKITGSATAQLVSTIGLPLGPRYQLPADYVLGSGVGSYLLLFNNLQDNLSILWDPRTGRVLRHFGDVIAAGPEQIALSPGCQGCRVQVLNVSTGTTVTTPIPGGNPAPSNCPGVSVCPGLTAAFSDDGKLLAVPVPGRELEVFDTASRTFAAVPGTAVSAEWQRFEWQAGGHRLVISSSLNTTLPRAQLAYWQPGDAALRVATVRNVREITNLEKGQFG
jgi:hypothetical protein